MKTRLIEWLQFAINIILAAIGVIAICIYGGQLRVMQGTLDEIKKQLPEMQSQTKAAQSSVSAIREQMKAAQRPGLGGEVSISESSTGNSSTTTHTIVVKNFGTAPALNVGLSMDKIAPGGFKAAIRTLCDRARKETANGRYIFPSDTYAYPVRRKFVSVGIGAPLDPNLDLAGCVAYFGVFKDFHHTEFCFTKGGGTPPIPCAVEQEAD